MWRVAEPVGVEKYRSIRWATIGWWLSLGGTPVASGMIGVMEKRSSEVAGTYSRRTGEYVIPQSRGSSPDANREELEEYFRGQGGPRV